jgi:hypothetical protein
MCSLRYAYDNPTHPALLGNHLVECQHCSVDNNTYCVQYLKLLLIYFATLHKEQPLLTTTIADYKSSGESPSARPSRLVIDGR